MNKNRKNKKKNRGISKISLLQNLEFLLRVEKDKKTFFSYYDKKK